MGKGKSKRRKAKLARPPKPQARKAQPVWETAAMPQGYDLDWEEPIPKEPDALDALDAPEFPLLARESERPFGSVDPSMYDSVRYKKFKDKLRAIRESVPDPFETFACYDLPDLALRRWLTRYCVQKEKGKLPDWQQVMLENAGFNWKRGHGPRGSQPSAASLRWSKHCKKLSNKLTAAKHPVLALLTGDDADYDWLRRQILRLNSGQLTAQHEAELRALPIDISLLAGDKGFTRWRASFKAFVEDEADTTTRWADRQRALLRAAKLPDWKIAILDAIGFDWKGAESGKPAFRKRTHPKVRVDPVKRMEDRWRAKLDRYLELEAKYGKPLSLYREDTAALRSWHARMREHYLAGKLRPDLIAEFEARGFEFCRREARKRKLDAHWNRQFAKLEAFKKRFGHVRVPAGYLEDPELGQWLTRQRERLTLGKLKGAKRTRLLGIGVEPSRSRDQRRVPKVQISTWLKAYQKLEKILKKEHGGRMPTAGHFGPSLRIWINRQRDRMLAGELESWQLAQLESIGFDPKKMPKQPNTTDWDDRMERLRRFVAENGHARVARSCPDKKLHAFVQRVRKKKRDGNLSERKIRELRDAGFVFDPYGEVSPAWMRYYEVLKAYKAAHGDCAVPRVYKPDQGLAEFVAQQKQRARYGKLLAEHIRLLDALGFEWVSERPKAKNS